MSRRRLALRRRKLPAWLVVVLLISSVALVTGLPYAIAARDAQSPDFPEVKTPLPLKPGVTIEGMQEARVYDIIDGDTIEVLIDGKLETVRYFGIDAPERGEVCFRDATERNRRLIGAKVLLLADARNRDSFDRLLRYVFKSDGTSIDATLVAEGFAQAWRADGQYRDTIVGLEGEARAAGRGCLWKTAA